MPSINHLNPEDCYCIQPKDRCYIFCFISKLSFSVDDLSSSRKNVAKCSEISSSVTNAVISTSKGCFFQSFFFQLCNNFNSLGSLFCFSWVGFLFCFSLGLIFL